MTPANHPVAPSTLTRADVARVAARDLEARALGMRVSPRIARAHLLAAQREIAGHIEALDRIDAAESRDVSQRAAFGGLV